MMFDFDQLEGLEDRDEDCSPASRSTDARTTCNSDGFDQPTPATDLGRDTLLRNLETAGGIINQTGMDLESNREEAGEQEPASHVPEHRDGGELAVSGPILYTEREPTTEEEKRAKQELDWHRRLIDMESEIMMQWRMEEERELSEQEGVLGVLMNVKAADSKGTKAEKNFVDAVNEAIQLCTKILSGVAELEPWWSEFMLRLGAVTHFLGGFVHHRFKPQAASRFQRIFDELAKPATGIGGIADRWRQVDKRRQARSLPEYRGKAERALATLVAQLQKAGGQLISSRPGAARKITGAIAKLQELPHADMARFAYLDPHCLPPVDPDRAFNIALYPLWSDAAVHQDITVGELQGMLVAGAGLPKRIRILQRPNVPGRLVEPPPEAPLRTLNPGSGSTVLVACVPPDLSDDSEGEEATAPERWWPFQTGPGKYPILKITSSSGTRMLAELRAAYANEAFQREYKEVRRSGRGAEHVAKALSVQCKILPKYGFAGTAEGVNEMRNHTAWWASLYPPIAKLLQDIHALLEYGKPLPKLPIIKGLTAQRFAPDDVVAWRRHLADEGFVVIAGIAQPREVHTALDLLWNFLESTDMSKTIRRSNVKSWDDREEAFTGWPAGKQDGIIHTRGMGQSKFLWYLRSLPALKRVFADLWGTEDLVTSFDGAGVFRPYGHRPEWKTTKTSWFHVDQGHRKRGLHCIQGLMTLLDANEKTGSLVVVPRSHRFHNDILSRYPMNGNGWNFIPLKPDDRILTEGNLGPRLVVAQAGDLVLWDSRTVHCNSPPLRESQLLRQRDLLRAVAYICMTPAAWCSPAVLEERERMVRLGVTTSHWPHELHAMTRYGGELAEKERSLESKVRLGEIAETDARPWLRKIEEQRKHLQDHTEALFTDDVIANLVRPHVEGQTQQCLPGEMSIMPEETFKVELWEGVPLRRAPTTEWEEPVGRVRHGESLHGHRFGRWLHLSAPPLGLDDRGSGLDGEDLWACMDGECDANGALRSVV